MDIDVEIELPSPPTVVAVVVVHREEMSPRLLSNPQAEVDS